MIEIAGRLKNVVVDARCYEVEARPAPLPKVELSGCGCAESHVVTKPVDTSTPQDVYPRVRADSEGSFVILIDDANEKRWFEGGQPRFSFRVYQNNQLKPTARSIMWTPEHRQGPFVLDLCSVDGPPPCGTVCGKVTDCRGRPLGGFRVFVFDVDLTDIATRAAAAAGNGSTRAKAETSVRRGASFGTRLGETVTNDCGEYCISYKYQDYFALEIDSADIRVVIGTPAGERLQSLQVSPIWFNAPSDIRVDLQVPGSKLDASSEYTDYDEALTKLGALTPGDRAGLSDEQLDFVCHEAAIPAEHLTLLHLAYEINQQFFGPLQVLAGHTVPQVLYGLLRMGVTGPFPSWARRYHGSGWDNNHVGDKLASLITQAIEQCIVSRNLGLRPGVANVDQAGLLIWWVSFYDALTTPLRPQRSSWLDLFKLIWLFPQKGGAFRDFAVAWLTFGVCQQMWDDLAVHSVLSAADIGQVKTLVEYAEISGFWAPAVDFFLNHQAKLVDSVKSEAAWATYFTVAPPPDMSADFATYSAEVLQLARAHFGVQGVAAWAGAITAGDFNTSPPLTNAQAIDSAQRISRLTTSADFATTLAAKGFTSARDIAGLRWEDFLAKLPTGTSRVDALYTYTKARETRAVTTAATLQLSPVLNSPIDGLPVPFLKKPDLSATTVQGMADTLGTTVDAMADNFFGSGTSCDCEGRQSVFSPAAYLHALRRFLNNVSGISAPVAKDQFDARRSDVLKLRLSYKNTYAVLPTIDLNIEVLEDMACQVLGIPIPTPPDRQTTLEAEELELVSEYENQYPALYDISGFADGGRVWPWRFPFDLNNAKRRIVLEAINLPRADILRLVKKNPTIYDLSDAALDWTESQRSLLLNPPLFSSAYGGVTLAQLRAVPAMLDRTRLSFQELYAVTELTHIYSGITAPSITPAVSPPASPPSTWTPPVGACDPASYTLNYAIGSAGEAQADRIHRFVRLWRALPWPLHLLDWAIGSFPLLDPDETLLAQASGEWLFPLKWLGAAELVRKRLKLKPEEVIGFWATLSTRRWDTPFVQSKAIPSPWEHVFRVRIEDVNQPAKDLTLAAAARAAGISEQLGTELATDLVLSWDTGPNAELIASQFFRYGRLSKAVPGVRPEDIKGYQDLRKGALPQFSVFGSPEDTWNAIEDFEAIRRSGARLSMAFPLYVAPSAQTIGVERRQMLASIEDLNRRTAIPSSVPFQTALFRFIPESTITVTVDKLASYDQAGATAKEKALLDAAIAELLALPELLTPPLLSVLTAANREKRVLKALADQLWNKEVGSLLSRATGLDAATSRSVAEEIRTPSGTFIIDQLKGLSGDGRNWNGWPATVSPTPNEQGEFLENGSVNVPSEAVSAVDPNPLSLTLSSDILVGAPGTYEVRAKTTFADGGNVQIQSATVTSGAVKVVDSFTVSDDEVAAVHSLLVTLTTDTACSIGLELVQTPSNTQAIPGMRLYSDSSKIDAAIEALELLGLVGTLAAQWKLSPEDLAALIKLQTTQAGFPQFPPRGAVTRPLVSNDGAGFDGWLTYVRLVAALKMTRGGGRQALYDTAALAGSVGATTDSVWPGLAIALDVEVKCVQDAAAKLFLSDVQALTAIANGEWLKLFDLCRALQQHGVSAKTFEAWGATDPGIDAVNSLDGSARAKLVESRSGTEKLRTMADGIRVLKRDVLTDFLLASPRQGLLWRVPKDISDYLLTDVEMEPCAQTSRIRFAIAAAQRLVTQTLAQSESLQLTAEQEIEWQSIFQYRLWEVRERILLYPETWLRFGRHLHKTPQFEELERSLLQGDLTDEKAGEALTRYVEQLHEIGHLEIVGSCSQQEFDVTGAVSLDRFHVIGRTPAEPRAYYHRERVDGAYWTPWTKIELDIDCDQIVPVVHNRQLHLFWLVEDTTPQKKPGIKKDDRQISLDEKYKTLRLAWSALTSKGWRAKMISKDSLSTRFGHYAVNYSAALGFASPYVEVHAWNEAIQETGSYQLHPTLSDENDVVIEVYARVVSTVVSKVDEALADWVYEFRQTLERLGWGSSAADWFQAWDNVASSRLSALLNPITANVTANLRYAVPTLPQLTPSGTRTRTSDESYLFGRFRLTPDNLVETTQRSAGSNGPPTYLTAADRAQTLLGIGSAVPRSGAFEFDDGSVELYAGGEFRTVLGTAGTPVRVVVTRQEVVPSQTDPVFCRIKNRSFFAFKEAELQPQLSLPAFDKQLIATTARTAYAAAGSQGFHEYQTMPREHVTRAAQVGLSAASAAGKAQTAGAYLAAKFAAARSNYAITSKVAPWRFALAHHPQTIELLRAVRAGLERLYKRETESDSRAATGSLTPPFHFIADYDPKAPWVDVTPDEVPLDDLEFKPDQAYAVPNWELLYHAPMTVSDQFMKVGRFDDSRRWITHVFNPRDPAARGPAGGPDHPENYWVFRPFVDFVAGNGVSDFANLDPNGNGDSYLQRVFRALIKQWRANPYNPHAVAVFRPQAYQLAAIFLYVENMIAWGDSLFAAPSAELVEEAARRYEEAERVIGRPPASTGAIRYDESALTVKDLDNGLALGSTLLENGLSLGDGPSPIVEDAFLPDLAIGYFCLPPNPRIKELRDTIQDRLFKVHHCLDLLGNPRKLPLYDPPINPALLADAAMAGLNVSQAVMDAYTPRPHYRFRTLLAIAKGLAQQVASLGSGLLSALEKQDAESLTLLKASHEAKVLERATEVRKLQIEDAQASAKALEATLNSVAFRQGFYATRDFMNPEETAQIVLSLTSTIFRIIGQGLNVASSAAGAAPDFTVGGAGAMSSPVALMKTGGANFSRIPAGLGRAMEMVGDFMSTFSSIAGSMGAYRRRKEDWDFQAKSAELELKQINAQILGAQIRQTIAERELANHEAQLEQSRDELDFVRSKQTAVRLYEWLAADIGTSYYRAFQLAHSMSLQAQRALQDELGSSQRFIGYSQWDNSHKGLQAGEHLMEELLHMESQYHAQNARPLVKTMNVSLALVDPIALAQLKVQGWCHFELREEFWDQYAPGLYFRRFSSVSVSVPAVVGPFGGLHGRLAIENARYRKDTTLLGDENTEEAERYAHQDDDSRFVEQFPRPGDVIMLSTGVRDTGLGADEPKEDRYRPFENLGVDSSWYLEISQQDNAFDLSTIADVVLHVEYTARDGGEILRNAARAALAKHSALEGFLVSLRQQYPRELQQLKTGAQVSLNFSPHLSAAGVNGDQRKVQNLNVGLLLRLKDPPDAGNKIDMDLNLNPPASASAAALATFKLSLDYTTPPDGNGAPRFALDTKSPDLSQADLQFGALQTAPWTMSVGAGDATEIEDAVVSVTWTLGESE